MRQLSSYVSRSVGSAMLAVLLLLFGLDLVFAYIGELEGIKGNYTAFQALVYILFTGPGRAYELLPTATLVGGIVGLGMLANHSELTVMRAAGVSIGRIVWWVLRPALVLVLAGLLLGQYVVPASERMAETHRALALGQDYLAGWLKSYWHRDGDDLLRIGSVEPDGPLHDLVFFHFDADGRLLSSTTAATARHEDGGWRLYDLRRTELLPDGSARVTTLPQERWASRLTPGFLRMVTLDPEYLSLTNLRVYARYMQQQGLDSAAYYLEFWKKTLAPLATLSMVLIACSFIFGPLRSVGMGQRILAGVLAGLLFRYAQDFLGYASLVYGFSPLLAAAIPISACVVLGGAAIARVR
jgi:lipopolysaccharide export system permease protein